ncbi:MAG: amidohydrolase [Bacillota bacterium]
MIAVTNARVLTITNGVISAGTVVIADGKILDVGEQVDIPKEAEVIDARGMWLMPGLIDAHSHVGVYAEPMTAASEDGNEMTDPITPQLRGLDSFDPNDRAIPDVLRGGVTALYTQPGSANVIGGTGMMVKLAGRTADEMRVPGVEHMKMALGENPKRVYGQMKKTAPATRMGNAAKLREALIGAENYLDKWAEWQSGDEEDRKKGRPERDLGKEMLGKVLTGEMKARIHCHRADDMMTAVRIAEEFNLDYSLEHATEGYKIADILAEKNVTCVVGPLLVARMKMELQDITLRNPGLLARAGVRVCLQMDGFSDTQWLALHAGLAVREGMPEEEAFRAVTLHPAQLLGVDDRMGSIEAGKDADLALFDGHPFHTYTRCQKVFIDGVMVFDRDDDCQ